jgi:hypothetical protein
MTDHFQSLCSRPIRLQRLARTLAGLGLLAAGLILILDPDHG